MLSYLNVWRALARCCSVCKQCDEWVLVQVSLCTPGLSTLVPRLSWATPPPHPQPRRLPQRVLPQLLPPLERTGVKCQKRNGK